MRRAAVPTLFICVVGLSACAAGPTSGDDGNPSARSGGSAARANDKPVAVLRDSMVTWDDLHHTLAEAAGAAALEEVILDRLLDAKAAAGGVRATDEDIAAERERLVARIAGEAGISPDQAQAQVDRVCRSRGLGPKRFSALLARNARLRALSRGDVTITPEQVDAEEKITNGERSRIRVFMHSSQAVCSAARERVLADDATTELIAARFADAAMHESTDTSSSARGGLLESVSPSDPAVPEAIANAITSLAPGQVSPVLVTGQGFALVLLEGRTAPAAVLPRDEVEVRLRSRLERIAMERYAQQLLREAQVTVLDDSLGWSWEAARGR